MVCDVPNNTSWGDVLTIGAEAMHALDDMSNKTFRGRACVTQHKILRLEIWAMTGNPAQTHE